MAVKWQSKQSTSALLIISCCVTGIVNDPNHWNICLSPAEGPTLHRVASRAFYLSLVLFCGTSRSQGNRYVKVKVAGFVIQLFFFTNPPKENSCWESVDNNRWAHWKPCLHAFVLLYDTVFVSVSVCLTAGQFDISNHYQHQKGKWLQGMAAITHTISTTRCHYAWCQLRHQRSSSAKLPNAGSTC